ncbi:MAG: hypothetical protein JWQ79_4260 [Mucilaginibacter sp.]|nr:hypothetical protein [Mucilaginibacter sp.]
MRNPAGSRREPLGSASTGGDGVECPLKAESVLSLVPGEGHALLFVEHTRSEVGDDSLLLLFVELVHPRRWSNFVSQLQVVELELELAHQDCCLCLCLCFGIEPFESRLLMVTNVQGVHLFSHDVLEVGIHKTHLSRYGLDRYLL